MKKTALITGITGQDGAYLARFLLNKDYTVIGIVRKDSSLLNLEYLGIRDRVSLIYGDIKNKNIFQEIFASNTIDEVYNLGGLTSPAQSWDRAEEYVDINIHGITGLLEVIKTNSPKTRLFQASTSEMFGNSNNLGLQYEDTPFHPTNPYAVTKLYGFWMTNIYRDSYDLFICNGILFNHESPLRNLKFVTRKISDGVARIKLGLADKIKLGHLDSKRDWGFAGDYVEAMWLMLQKETPDNFILSTGEIHTIEDFLRTAFEYVGISDWRSRVVIDPGLVRPVNLLNLYGKSDKAKKVLGWEPKVKFKELVEMMVEADLKRLGGKQDGST